MRKSKMTIKEIFVFIILCLNTGIFAVQMKNSNMVEDVMILLNEFQIKHPTILTSSRNTNLLRKLFSEDNSIKAVTKINLELSKSYQSILIFVDSILNLHDLQAVMNELKFALIIFQNDSLFDDAYQSLEIEINKKIYFYNTPSQELFESYKINNREIKQKLGNVDQIAKMFVWEDGINSDFINRRSNFHGLILKGE